MAKRQSVKAIVKTSAKTTVKKATVKPRVKKAGPTKAELALLAEAESLIQEANAAVYEHSGPEFVSQKKFRAVDFPAKLKAVDWFANVGKPVKCDVTMPVEQVKSWAHAIKHLKSRNWDNTLLDSQNQLTQYLHDHCMERYRDWNKIVTKFRREVVVPLTKKQWEPFRKSQQLDEKLIQCLQLNIHSASMENAYIDCKHGSFFNSELFRIYEAGHFPCGWKGRWPQGTLLVY